MTEEYDPWGFEGQDGQQLYKSTSANRDNIEELSGARHKKPTEKGLLYCLEIKEKSLNNLSRQLEVKNENYRGWLTLYEDYLGARDEYKDLLAGSDEDRFSVKDAIFSTFKTTVEKWFLRWSSRSPSTINIHPEDSASQVIRSKQEKTLLGGSRVTSLHGSAVSAARVKTEQHRVEIDARRKALEKRRSLGLARLKLKLDEEQLQLDTELEICHAKSKVLDELECVREQDLNKSPETSQVSRRISFTHASRDRQGNLNAPSFMPSNKVELSSGNALVEASASKSDQISSIHASRERRGLSNVNASSFVPGNRVEMGTGNAQIEASASNPICTDTNFDRHITNPTVLGTNTDKPEPTPASQIASVVRQLRKPVPEIKKFGGDPLEYKRFIRQFNTKIVVNTEDDEERMNYLEQYTKDEAYKIVSGFGYLSAETGYSCALKELEERYGNNEVMANAFIKRALDWPVIKPDNPKALDRFGIFLTECENAIYSIEAVKVLEYPDNLKKLVGKLPYFYHDKWRNIVQQNRAKSEMIKFSQFVNFVKIESKKANDPTYGREALRVDPKQGVVQGRRPVVSKVKESFASHVTDVQTGEKRFVQRNQDDKQSSSGDCAELKRTAFSVPCLYCDKSQHCLEKCDKISALPYQERIDFLRNRGLCYGCLRIGHQRKLCRNKSTCLQCQGRYPTICHVEGWVSRINGKMPQKKISEHKEDANATSACANVAYGTNRQPEASDGECTMAIVPVSVRLRNGMKSIQTYAFLDPGSSATFCTEDLCRKLGASGKPMKITLDTMGTPYFMHTLAVQGLEVSDLKMENIVTLPTVYTKEQMPVSGGHIPTMKDVNQWSHLKDIELPTIEAEIGLGNNVPDAYTPLMLRTGTRGSPHATKSLIGWIVWNVVRPISTNAEDTNTFSVNRTSVAAIQNLEDLKQLNQQVQKSVSLDFPERSIDDRKEHSQEDKRFLNKVSNSVKFVDGHYSVNLPFKNDSVKFPNNESQARQRLKSLKSKMAADSKFKEDYTIFMANILDKGYAERVPECELDRSDEKVWYIPHHGVYHLHKPEKIRVVFDCTATYQGVCLNSLLLQGPDLTNNLIAVLLRFRQENVAQMGDIESMFYQVKVPKEDADCLRFLWWPSGDTGQDQVVYRMVVHLFGAVSSPSCSNAALLETVNDNKDRFDPYVTDVIRRNFYVDDSLASVTSEVQAIALVRDVTDMCQLGGFRITKWISNSRNVLESIPPEERAKEVRHLTLECESLPNERALGVHWSVEQDTIGFSIQPRITMPTRSGILSLVSSVYDPLVFAAPYVLTAKIILQDLCRQAMDWDEEISGRRLKAWQEWLEGLALLKNIQLERCYKPQNFGNVSSCQLHVFSDASENGYGAAIYLRLTDDECHTHCTLVMGKSRVSPLKRVTIPRLELTAATIAVRLSRMVLREIDYPADNVHFWTDSMTVIRYISNETTRFQTFVSNRVAVIREGSEVHQWNYVQSKQNPADCASRGLHMDKFLQQKEWVHGPKFLSDPETEWPKFEDNQRELPDDDPEVKVTTNATIVSEASHTLDCLLQRQSNWLKLRSTLGWILVAVEKFKKLASHTSSKEYKSVDVKEINLRLKTAHLSMETLRQAEVVLVKHVQSQHFQKEINVLTNKSSTRNLDKASPIRRLDPVMVDGVLRVGGRLDQASIPYAAKHPIILPKSSNLSHLLLQHTHEAVGHLGRNTMLAALRQNYWIVGASAATKKLVAKCVRCRKYQARGAEEKMADLPPDRLAVNQSPFTSVGMDYFGPIEVKRGRTLLKRYGVVFTCLTSRAIHLELACSLDTESCINAIRRFIARRGPVEIIRSDNGTNLVGSERELREEIQKWNQVKIHQTLQQKNITWIFNPPAGSHHGGVWERMIRTVRKVLHSLLHQQVIPLNDESLNTLFCEVESILNGRPISKVSSDSTDLEALTPNHLLLMRLGECLPPGQFDKADNYANRRWRQVQYLANILWTRWTGEYLPLLQERQKWLQPRRNIKVEDIVLIIDTIPRNAWCLGRVVEVMKDRKGLVRSVKVKTKSTHLVRPIDKLCLILEAGDSSSCTGQA